MRAFEVIALLCGMASTLLLARVEEELRSPTAEQTTEPPAPGPRAG